MVHISLGEIRVPRHFLFQDICRPSAASKNGNYGVTDPTQSSCDWFAKLYNLCYCFYFLYLWLLKLMHYTFAK